MGSNLQLILSVCFWLGNIAAISSVGQAAIVYSTFEESDLAGKLDGNQTFRGETLNGEQHPSSFSSGFATFYNNGKAAAFGYWDGIGLSRRTAPGAGQKLYDEGNDLISKPGTGAGGSATWAVAYEGFSAPTTLSAAPGYQFNALDITNTLYTWTAIVTPEYGAQFGNNDFFKVTFTNTDTLASKDVYLADYRNGANFVLDTWQSVDVSSLSASNLGITFSGTKASPWGLLTPTYVALDNVAVASVTAVPEPSSFALLGAAGAISLWYRRRARSARQQAQ